MKQQTEFLTYHLLKIKQEASNAGLTDYIVDNNSDEELEAGGIKNVCAKLHVHLVDEIDKAITTLGISKRQFIEIAVINALSEYHDLYDELEVGDHLEMMAKGIDQEGQ